MRKKRTFHLRLFGLPDQVVRIVVIFTLGLTALVTLRNRFIPETFGELGHYRAAAIDLNANKPIRYVGWQTCYDCHDDVVEKKAASYHRLLSCEVCHGPGYDHAEVDFDEYTPYIPHGRKDCLICHEYLAARPTGFPQIIELQHNPAEPCVKCHDPHDPTPPETPGACSGCHGEIARTKSLSHHRIVPCQICHDTPAEHMTSPRMHLPTKPRQREFCGQCHGKKAKPLLLLTDADIREKDVPRVDLTVHGNTYVCWQCHYPHYPEAK